ncbi:hypothetical protein [Wenzhouxiangella sediminis]|jgi:hypothetical protein|uniref:Uncharacterized protein n=1 Tax=Wenzhouxiangella sediminis TaxID=1792836 RepID=A0A3E1K981_9GAMM|nr:hypothetical protein [Wenzhouxiangella sediminis]MEE4304352.1 hypothetical protein [Wenzhouxiangella sp.]RFF30683.1 hypothetical protein DZC52_07055 [Wenzhouxiangella sediminis]
MEYQRLQDASRNDPDLNRAQEQFESALESVAQVTSIARAGHLPRLFNATLRLLKLPGGPARIHGHAGRFDEAGVFEGSDWDHPERLQPDLSRGSLTGAADAVAVEALSRLRMLAIAEGSYDHPDLDAAGARDFLQRSLVVNLDLLQPDHTEAGRAGKGQREAVRQLLSFELDRLGGASVVEALVAEADGILEQRPIDVSAPRQLLDHVEYLLEREDLPDSASLRRGRQLLAACHGPTELTRASVAECMTGFEAMTADEREAELAALGESMGETGLACPGHGAIVALLADKGSDRQLSLAMGLDAVGSDSLDAFNQLVRALIREAVGPATAQCLVGLSNLLDRGTLFFPPVPGALWRLTRLEPLPEVSAHLREEFGHADPPSGHSLLLAGVISVLGLPLGVGQGNNPTCQSARAISLWAQVDPGFLLEMVTWAARDNEIDLHFEGDLIRSSELTEGLIEDFHTDLDTVSLVLVPHLDKIYWEMGRRIVGRGEDGHRWINPEFHGWWVNRGFATTIDYATGAVADFAGFIRQFHAAYHPDFNDGAELIYPQPAGIVATDPFGNYVGLHAIAIQRVELDDEGVMRVYFYNPNNEGRQDWGQEIVTSTRGRGEIPGESSLPFEQFCARLYVFHYNERELGDPLAVPDDSVESIARMVRESWARERAWHEVVTR